MKAMRFVPALAVLLASCATFAPASLRDRCRPVYSIMISTAGGKISMSHAIGASVILMASDDGALLLTANHIVASATLVGVVGPDGKHVKAVVLRAEPERDLALIFAKGLTGAPARIAKHPVRIGDRLWVTGIHAFSSHGVYVVPGTVSTDLGPCISPAQGCFLARIEGGPGSSGSPVFDQNGRLAGMVQGGTRRHPRLSWVIGLQNIVQFLVGPAPQSVTAPPPA